MEKFSAREIIHTTDKISVPVKSVKFPIPRGAFRDSGLVIWIAGGGRGDLRGERDWKLLVNRETRGIITFSLGEFIPGNLWTFLGNPEEFSGNSYGERWIIKIKPLFIQNNFAPFFFFRPATADDRESSKRACDARRERFAPKIPESVTLMTDLAFRGLRDIPIK